MKQAKGQVSDYFSIWFRGFRRRNCIINVNVEMEADHCKTDFRCLMYPQLYQKVYKRLTSMAFSGRKMGISKPLFLMSRNCVNEAGSNGTFGCLITPRFIGLFPVNVNTGSSLEMGTRRMIPIIPCYARSNRCMHMHDCASKCTQNKLSSFLPYFFY